MLILPIEKVDRDDVRLVGGKGANLGEITRAGFSVPKGFVLTAEAYRDFIQISDLKPKIHSLLDQVNLDKSESLAEASAIIKRAFLSSKIPKATEDELKLAYRQLGGGKRIYVAVRSSSTGEDLLDATGAGARITLLNVYGEDELVRSVKEVWASLFTPRSIFYSREKKKDLFQTGIAVVVQEMVESKVSGVSFSLDPVTNNKSVVVVEAIYGLGELIAQGQVTPDHFELDKKTLEITYKEVGLQDKQLVRVGREAKETKVSPAYGASQKITDALVQEIAAQTRRLEQHYLKPQDAEWAYDGKRLYIVQARPVTTASNAVSPPRRPDMPIVLAGAPGSPGMSSGRAVIISSPKELDKINQGDILISEFLSPDFVPAMKRAAAIITDKGGRTSHAAIISRELGVPAVVGTGTATKNLTPGKFYTVNGTVGHVYAGTISRGQNYLPYQPKLPLVSISGPLKTATKVMATLSDPVAAWEFSKLNLDGAIVAPESLIRKIEVHPGQAIKEGLGSAYVQKLTEGVLSICQAMQGKTVLYRLSNFTSPELAKLKDGGQFETTEVNPKLGLRGAKRHLLRQDELSLELEVIRKVRNVHGAKNLHLLVPFVRTPEELSEIKKLVTAQGLHRGNNFKIYISGDVPINILALERFKEIGLDGIVGGEHLLELLLGVDLSHDLWKEAGNHESIRLALEKLGREAKKIDLAVGFNFERITPDDELLETLVKSGYSFISVSPDAVERTRQIVSSAESEISKK